MSFARFFRFAQLLYRDVGIALIASGFLAGAAVGQPQSVSFERTDGPSQVTFRPHLTQVGDTVDQRLGVDMQLRNQVRQSEQILQSTDARVLHMQRRQVEVLEVADGRAVKVRVRFNESKRDISEGEIQPPASDPVEGKTYVCQRRDDQLLITEPTGAIPPMDQYQIVARAMEALGRANPWMEFLGGKTVQVGEQLAVPPGLAAELLGFGTNVDEVVRFDLTLSRVVEKDGRTLAEFDTHLKARASGAEQMGMEVEGPVWVDGGSCRVVLTDLRGPVGMSQTVLTPEATQQLAATGHLTVRVEAQYRDR